MTASQCCELTAEGIWEIHRTVQCIILYCIPQVNRDESIHA
jgi:hypothetical protein